VEVNDGEPDAVWLRTLSLQLRALYDRAPDGSDATLTLELDARLAALRAASASRYRIAATIATGGMGHVLRAIDTTANRIVAIKRAAPTTDRAESVRRRLRLLAEARTIAMLRHPGVVPIHDLGIDADGEPFFAMQCVEGDSLAQLLAAGSLPLPRLAEIVRRVAETMAYAHSQGIVHRDLKPANVMVGAWNDVFVLDWGLARATGATSSPLPARGRPPATISPARRR
jgi:eukaryotic-like serine/threonine-protein kinase